MAEKHEVDRETLGLRLSEVPGGMQPHIRRGFELLDAMAPEQFRSILHYVTETMASEVNLSRESALERSGISENAIADVLTALTFTGATISDLNISVEDFIESCQDSLIPLEKRDIVSKVLIYFIERRAQIHESLEGSALAAAVLPSFRSLNLAVDLRAKFSNSGLVERSVPVLVAHLATDSDKDQVFFQADIADVKYIAEKMQKILDNMERLKEMKLQ